MEKAYRIEGVTVRGRVLRTLIAAVLVLGVVGVEPAAAEDEPLQEILQRASAGGSQAWSLRVDCVGAEFIRSMSLVAGEVGVWDLWTQVTVPAATRRDLARTVLEGGFFSLQREYGGKVQPDAGKPAQDAQTPSGENPPARAQRVICRVEVGSVLDGEPVRRSSIQFADGEQSAELKALANRLLDRVAPLAAEGVRPADFAEALGLLREGKLDARLLGARLVEIPRRGADVSGRIFRIEDGWASAQAYMPGRLVGDVARRRLAPDSLDTLVAALSEAEFEKMPVNLWAEDQIEVHVEVLGHQRSVYARPFARLEGQIDEARQRGFAELLESFRRLAETVQ